MSRSGELSPEDAAGVAFEEIGARSGGAEETVRTLLAFIEKGEPEIAAVMLRRICTTEERVYEGLANLARVSGRDEAMVLDLVYGQP